MAVPPPSLQQTRSRYMTGDGCMCPMSRRGTGERVLHSSIYHGTQGWDSMMQHACTSAARRNRCPNSHFQRTRSYLTCTSNSPGSGDRQRGWTVQYTRATSGRFMVPFESAACLDSLERRTCPGSSFLEIIYWQRWLHTWTHGTVTALILPVRGMICPCGEWFLAPVLGDDPGNPGPLLRTLEVPRLRWQQAGCRKPR